MNFAAPHFRKTLFLIAGLILFILPCHAQEHTFSPSVDIEPTPDTPSIPLFSSIRNEFLYYDEAWFPFLLTLTERNKTEALRVLDSVYNARLNYGDKNASYYSYALLALSKAEESEGDVDTASQLIDEAVKLSPDIPRLQFYKAAFLWRNTPGRLYDIVNLYATGAWLALTDVTIVTVLGANLLLAITITILTVFVLFSLSLAAKYVLAASNDVKDRLGWDVPLLLFSAFIAVLLVFLFSLDIGLIWLVIIVNMAFLVYYTKTEKRILAFFYVLIVSSPIILNYTAALMLSTHRDVIAEMIQVRDDIYTQDTEKKLANWSADNPDDVYALFTLGQLNKRIGYLDYARRYYEKAVELRPSFGPALNNLGVIYFILKDYNRAEEFFISANTADPDLVAPYYNLYKVGMTRFDLKTAEEYYDQAIGLSPERITRFLDIEIKENEGEPTFLERTNRMVIDEDLTDSMLWGRVFTMTEPKELANNLFGDMMKGMGLRAAPFVGVVGLVLLLISGSLSQRLILSKYCRFCGLPFLIKSQSHLERRDSCNRCFSVFVRKEGVDPRTKADLRMKVDRTNYLRRIALIVTNLVIPGFGRIYRGKVWRGFVFLSLFLIFFVQFVTPRGIVTYPISAEGLPLIHTRYLYGIACAIIYILAQRDLIKSETSEA